MGPALQRTFDLCNRALRRGQGPTAKAPEVQLAAFTASGKRANLCPGKVAFPFLTYALALNFMLRRLELEMLKVKDIQVSADKSKVTVYIKESKMDQESRGVSKTLVCACKTSKASCPVELALELLELTRKKWPTARGDPEAWLVRTTEGEHATKATVVSSWSMAAVQGHSARRSGPLFYTRVGVPVPEITYLGRWHSDLVFKYAEEAWESRPCNLEPSKGRRPSSSKATQGQDPAEPPPTVPSVEEFVMTKPKFVRSYGRSSIAHLIHDTADVTSSSWRTKCGWHFARGATHFKLLASLTPDLKCCRKCRFGPGGSARQANGQVEGVCQRDATGTRSDRIGKSSVTACFCPWVEGGI